MTQTLERTPPPRSHSRRARLSVGALGVAAALALGGIAALPTTQAHAATDTGVPNGDVIANLWEWNWDSVTAECTNVLDPAGYGAVQVAPPTESLKQSNYYWWDVYQPYSYNLNSRFGTATEFANMVTTCHDAGIKVYIDAVINHTAAQTGTGYNGTTISNKYDTPDWNSGDYHQSDDCSDSDMIIDDWSNLTEIQNCELLGLPDLETEESSVRQGIADYLNDLLAVGVDGFRIDAAKHIPTTDLSAIEGLLNDTTAGGDPYVFQEVYPGTTPTAASYQGTGDVLDFVYADKLEAQFESNISNLETFGSTWGFVDEAYSSTFVTNHDTDRNGYTLSMQQGDITTLANIYQLARGYGVPSIYASWNFSTSDQAPPNSGGFVTDTNCSSGWTCLNRDTAIKGMVGFHNATDGESYTNFQAKSSNVIGFSRGTVGFIAINNTSSSATYTYATNLADGTYCNVIDDCASTVTVSGGSATITVGAMDAVAIYDGDYVSPTPTATATTTATATATATGSTVTATFNEYASTTLGTNVYVVGSISALGSWSTSSAIQLSSDGYPIWTRAVSVPASSTFEYKYIKKDSSGNVTWESNANRSVTTGTSAITVNNSWNIADASATDVTFNAYATTTTGTNVYVVGSIASLGSWDTDEAIPLSSASYPTWSRLAIAPRSTAFEYKYIKKDASGNVTWESGSNRSYTTGTSTGYTTGDTWK